MSNMSYCMFENTSSDLQDCIDKMMHAESFNDMDLSESERDHMEVMRDQCEFFLDLYDNYNE